MENNKDSKNSNQKVDCLIKDEYPNFQTKENDNEKINPSWYKIFQVFIVQLELLSSMIAVGSLSLPSYFLATYLKDSYDKYYLYG